MRVLDSLLGRSRQQRSRTRLEVEALEARDLLAATPTLAGGVLTVVGGPFNDNIAVLRDPALDVLIVLDSNQEVARFASAAVGQINIFGLDGNDIILVGPTITQNATLDGGGGLQRFNAGGDELAYRGLGMAVLIGGPGDDRLLGGPNDDQLFGNEGNDQLFGGGGANVLVGGPGRDRFYGTIGQEVIPDFVPGEDHPLLGAPARNLLLDEFLGLTPSPNEILTAGEVDVLLQRATASTASRDAIIAIVDRSGRILGVRVEDGVDPAITGSVDQLVFAIDGAVAKARTGAFFGNNQAPLTSRTIQNISQSTISQREVESNPNITDPNSTLRGPGFVAPVSLGNHFPPGVAFTPQVDLQAIEHTNRDSIFAVGFDNIRGTADDVRLLTRFNVNPAFVPDRIDVPGAAGTIDPLMTRSTALAPPDSYGVFSGLLPTAQSRGIATLPGGIPIFKRDDATGQLVVVGGIGVFFPGRTGFATEENSSLSVTYDPARLDRSMEAEFIAFTALGGSSQANLRVGALGGVAPLPQLDLPAGRIDLVGITLDVFGPKGNNGPSILVNYGTMIGPGVVNGTLQPLLNPGADNIITPDDVAVVNLLDGTPVPEGFLVQPHDSADGTITADDVRRITFNSVQEALITRAAIRLPMDSPAIMMITVTSKTGEILGQFRMPDATVFSIDVSTAKARNVAYYNDPAALLDIDQIPGLPKGVAFTARTFRFVALPRFPEGIDGAPPGPFSQLNDDPGIDRFIRFTRDVVQPQDLFYDVRGTGLQVGPPAPASQFQSVFGFNSFNPATNFHDMRTNGVFDPANPLFFQNNLLNRDGIVFFPGSSGVYKGGVLVGGFGISGDGVDQDDVVTAGGIRGFEPPPELRADMFFVRGVRLPYQKFNRQPNINPFGSTPLGSGLENRT